MMTHQVTKESTEQDKPPAIIVAGPTASGKSQLALDLAMAFNGTVINADSMQIYDALPTLTAQPSAEECALVPHLLYGVLRPDERCSAGRWRRMALEAMAQTVEAGRLPVLAGGTGLYLTALSDGIAEIPTVPRALVTEVEADLARLGGAVFLEDLGRVDPLTAAKLHPNDRQRLVRAMSVYQATGKPLSYWQAEAGKKAEDLTAPYRLLWVVLLPDGEEARASLYERCDQRLEAMMAAGALEEVRDFEALGLEESLPACKILGRAELAALLKGQCSYAEALEQAKAHTRQYAKRQMTFIRSQILGHNRQIILFNAQYSESQRTEIFSKIRNKLLT